VLKLEKKLFQTLVILLVSKLQEGNDVKAQFILKLEKKLGPIVPVILLVLKLPVGSEVRAQLLLKL